MWGYSYTTTNGKLVLVYFGGNGTGDVYTYTFDNYVNWNATATYGNSL